MSNEEQQQGMNIDEATDAVINVVMELKKLVKTQNHQLQGLHKINQDLDVQATEQLDKIAELESKLKGE